jgi:hypothetical protein
MLPLNICAKAKDSSEGEEFILYAPSELLKQVERQIKAEFKDIITSFESFYEDEFTSIIVEIREMACHIYVDERCFQIINSIIGDEYIVDLLVRPIESIDQPDGLFNLTYEGAGNTFFVDYYAPERPRSNPFKTSIYYTTMIEAMGRVYLDSPSELWGRLFRPIKEVLAKRQGVNSFCKELAPDLRCFLLENLNFIERMHQSSDELLEVPQLAPLPQPSNGTEPTEPSSEGRVTAVVSQYAQTLVPA